MTSRGRDHGFFCPRVGGSFQLHQLPLGRGVGGESFRMLMDMLCWCHRGMAGVVLRGQRVSSGGRWLQVCLFFAPGLEGLIDTDNHADQGCDHDCNGNFADSRI